MVGNFSGILHALPPQLFVLRRGAATSPCFSLSPVSLSASRAASPRVCVHFSLFAFCGGAYHWGSMASLAPACPPAMVNRVRAVAAQLAAVRAHLRPLLEAPTKTTLEKLAPLERARLEVALGFAINALFFVYLKTRGANPTEHPVKSELDKIKGYLRKLRETEKKQKLGEEGGKKGGSGVAVDTSVAKRIVVRTLGLKGGKKRSAPTSSSSPPSAAIAFATTQPVASSSSNNNKKRKRTTKTATRGVAP